MKNENVFIEIPKLKKNQSYIETPETFLGNISFHSVTEKCKKQVNTQEIFSQKWVLNKLIEMDCEKIEEFKNTLPEMQQLQYPKEELLSICLDILTNQSMNNKEKSILEQFFEESKSLIKPSIQRLEKMQSFNEEFLSKSLFLNQEKEKIQTEKTNKSMLVEKSKDCEGDLILFSENSIAEQIKKDEIFRMKNSEIAGLNSPSNHSLAHSFDISLQNKKPVQRTQEKTHSLKIFNNKEPPIIFDIDIKKPSPLKTPFDISYAFSSENSSAKILRNIIIPPVLPHLPPPLPDSPYIKPNCFFIKRKDSNLIKLKGGKSLYEDIEDANFCDVCEICEICLDVFPKCKQMKAGKCDHIFCKSCLRGYLIEMIKSGKVVQIACPKEGCKVNYTDEEIKEVLKKLPDMIKKYEKFKLQISLSKDPNIRWCIRLDCEHFFKGSSAKPKLTCPCGEEICFNCSRKWHEGKTCDELMDQDYETYRQKNNVINCSKCQARIEKISGCNHIICSRCKYEFCWICGRKYSKRHYKNYNVFGCPGMMYRTFQRDKHFKYKIYKIKMFNVLKAVGFFILLLLSPVIALFLLVGLPNMIYYHDKRAKFTCGNILMFTFLLIIGIIFFPIFLAMAIIPGSCIFICQVIKENL